VVQNIPLQESWSLFPSLAKIFQFTFITNTGAAFGVFPQLGGLFMVVAVVVIAAIIIFHHHLPTHNIWVRISLGLQLGGAMGNVLDRMLHGYVVDFIDVGFWPIFNIADLAIVLGVSILAYHLWHAENSLDGTDNVPRLSEGGNL
jgi:signal peptidase II